MQQFLWIPDENPLEQKKVATEGVALRFLCVDELCSNFLHLKTHFDLPVAQSKRLKIARMARFVGKKSEILNAGIS